VSFTKGCYPGGNPSRGCTRGAGRRQLVGLGCATMHCRCRHADYDDTQNQFGGVTAADSPILSNAALARAGQETVYAAGTVVTVPRGGDASRHVALMPFVPGSDLGGKPRVNSRIW